MAAARIPRGVARLRDALPNAITGTGEFRGQLSVYVKRESIVDVARFLRDDPELNYNFLANLTGQPPIVLPCGLSKGGLPIGLQLVGRRWHEAKLLGVAKILEKLLPPCPVPPNYAD